MKILQHPSPNHKARRPGVRVDTVLLHHTGGGPKDNSLSWLCNHESMVSAHYLVDRDGTVYQLVEEARAALHAGVGRMPWEPERGYDFNHRSIGIEVVNRGDGKEPFTEEQYQALTELVPAICRRRFDLEVLVRPSASPPPATLYNFVMGHRDIACDMAGRYGRKNDPADNFQWARIRAALNPRRT